MNKRKESGERPPRLASYAPGDTGQHSNPSRRHPHPLLPRRGMYARRDGGGVRSPPGRWQRYGALVPGHGGSWRGKGAGDAFRWPLCFGRAAVVSTVCPVARLRLHRQGHICGRDGQRWVEVGRLGQIWRCLTVERRVRW
jgi:hypothetical protein